MDYTICMLPGDGIGPEVLDEARNLLEWIDDRDPDLNLDIREHEVGGVSIDRHGEPLTEEVLESARGSDAILLGAVGGPKWDELPVDERPEQALLALRSGCELFANLRPIKVFPELVDSSPLKNEVVSGADFLIVRELTGGIYFSEPRGIEEIEGGKRGYNTLSYSTPEVRRITEVALEAAEKRSGKLTSVDKANILESSQVWRETVVEVVGDRVELDHLYVDNAAMQLIGNPNQFDVVLTGNLFGDILSDAAAQLCGSIGLLPSASLGNASPGMYEPVHGSAPDITGQELANPLATVLSVAMMFRYDFEREDWADRIESAVADVLADGHRTADLTDSESYRTTREMGAAVVSALRESMSS